MLDLSNVTSELQEYEDQRKEIQAKKSATIFQGVLVTIAVLIVALLFGDENPVPFVATIIVALVSLFVFYYRVVWPFETLKYQVRETLLKLYMNQYHPGLRFKFYPEKKHVKAFISGTDLVQANVHNEEDVIIGQNDNVTFYISEISLRQSNGKTSSEVFKGLLFNLTLPGRKFPRTRIKSKQSLLNSLFSKFVKNEDYNFWYETEDSEVFNQELSPLFPFIAHLQKYQGDVRISTMDNNMTILLSSNMKFLDEPKPTVDGTFLNQNYIDNIGVQLNSLLYIVEAFSSNIDTNAIEERLELKAIEMAKVMEQNPVNRT